MNTIKHLISCLLLILITLGCTEDQIDSVSFGKITGKVVKKSDNTPLANAKVSTSPTSNTVYTDSNGNFTIPEIPVGEYSVKAELSGYQISFEPAHVSQTGQTVNIILELADDTSNNTPPPTPTLISPADNASNQPSTVTLTWSCTDPDNDALTYEVILKNSANSDVITVPDVTATSYTFDNLVHGVSYFWQITASDGINNKVYSQTNQFKIVTITTNRFSYVKKQNGNYYIVSSKEDGTNSYNITPTSFTSYRPRLNNSANRIAFIRNIGGNSQIFTSLKDGSDVQQVTTVPVTGFKNEELDFAWESSGNSLIYPNFDKLYRINKDGSGLTLLYTTPDGNFISECDWSTDGTKIALKTNNNSGYNVKIYIINMQGSTLATVLSNVNGGAGGINFSIAGDKLLYTRDVSGYENYLNYRQLDSRIFVYNLNNNTNTDLSALSYKPSGINDLDPRFSPNDGEIIFMSTSNDNISQKKIIKLSPTTTATYERTTLFTDAEMPDWE